MQPEDLSLELEPGRVRRILRKLLGKLGDLEEEVALRPSVYGSKTRRDGEAQGTGRIPPAHPFETQLLQNARRQPRYTYKRRRCTSSGNSSEGNDDVTAGAPVRTRGSGAAPLSRSASMGSLSDSDMSSSGQDPALWLTTPRKRLKRRPAAAGIEAAGLVRASSAGAQEQSFAARLETLIVRSEPRAVNTYKAKCLVTHMTHLGEMLWLGSPVSSTGQVVRALPLKVLAAFKLGEAIAHTADFSDLDYLDEMYSSIPTFLARFVLWQHATTLCYLRAPAYADALSEALWQVGAFSQQEWLINARMEDLQPVAALLKPENVAPLHLRAIDIGTESRFVDRMLIRLAAMRRGGDADGVVVANSLWLQFVSAGTVPNISAASNDEDQGVRGLRRMYSNNPGPARIDSDKVVASRYAKWVARISDPVQSVRILAAALEDALDFALGCAAGRGGNRLNDSEATDMYVSMAAQAAKTACSIIYTRLGGAATEVFAGSGNVAIDKVRRCIDLLAQLSGVYSDQTMPSARVSGDAGTQTGMGEVSVVCQTGLVLLTLRQLRSEQPSLMGMAKRLLKRICENRQVTPLKDADGTFLSRRKVIAARFDVLLEANLNLSHFRVELPLESKLFEAAVQPLAVAGASPEALLDISRLVATDLGRPGMARAMASAVLARFDAIWAHHHECREWQKGWSQLQAGNDLDKFVTIVATNPSSDAEILAKCAVQRQLECLASAPDQPRTDPPASVSSGKAQGGMRRSSTVRADVVEDELGLLLVRGRSRIRRPHTAAHIQGE
ncbi:hypothetical protein H4S07_000528 [Coemansia furcata]|uniref:Uncharacterized protein n=1 Tax=Coemansia furcata TaxID=417177 RepID=A0ACC1LQH3_9FUNG|nr:hypothetical protein H4S07_000528 [Coemansia furcata]